MSRVQWATKSPLVGSHTSYSVWLEQHGPSYQWPTTTMGPIHDSAKLLVGTGELTSPDSPSAVSFAACRVVPVTQATERPSLEMAKAGEAMPPLDSRRSP